MTNNEFQKLINDAIKYGKIHSSIVHSIEKEYKKRFGFLPGEIDDMAFIDAIIHGQNDIYTVAELNENAKQSIIWKRQK